MFDFMADRNVVNFTKLQLETIKWFQSLALLSRQKQCISNEGIFFVKGFKRKDECS